MTDESFMTEADIICERLHKAEDLLKDKDAELERLRAELQKQKENSHQQKKYDDRKTCIVLFYYLILYKGS